MLPVKLQMTLILIVLLYFIVLCVFLKNKALSLKYTLLWLFAGVVMGALVGFPQLLMRINRLIGIQGNMNGLFIWAIGFVICILLSLTSIVSRQNAKIRQLIQSTSRLEMRIRELEQKSVEDKDNEA